MSDYISGSKNCDNGISVDNLCSQYQDFERFYRQSYNESQKRQLDNGSPTTVTTEESNISFFDELEKILSAQAQILNNASQNALKVRGSCGIPQRPHNETKATCVVAKSTTKQNIMTGLLPRAGSDSGMVNEPNNNVPINMHRLENAFLFNYPKNVQVPQPVLNCIAMSKSHSTAQSQFVQTQEQTNVKILQKKAAHNKIERRRRSFINDKIAELQSLLPEDINRTSCINKSSILKESVDYIKKLQSDFAVIYQLKEIIFAIDRESKQIAMRLEVLEMRTTSNDVNTKSPSIDQIISSASEGATDLIFDTVTTKLLSKTLPTMSQTIDLDDRLDNVSFYV